MDIKEFGRGISLRDDVLDKLEQILSEEQFAEYKKIYKEDHERFFETVLTHRDFPRHFLFFFCRMACDVFEEYKRQGIPERVFWDTFRDIRYWCENAWAEFGDYGIHEYQWFWRHVDMTVFRLGRLEFELMNAEHMIHKEHVHIKAQSPVVNIHIPQGEPLHWEACEESLAEAYRWFGTEKPYICHSWLLYPGLRELLPVTSHIIIFQKKFTLLQTDFDVREAEHRIFETVRERPEDYSEHTTLQKKAKQYLIEGNKLGNGLGILPVPSGFLKPRAL